MLTDAPERLNFRLLGPVQFMFHSIIALTANTTRLTCFNSRGILMSIFRLITENETASVSKLKVKTKGSKRPYKTRSDLLNKHLPLFLCAYCSSVPTIPLLFSSAFPCISLRNINSGTLKNVRVSISCKLCAISSHVQF